jgi:hypothetical protein
MMSLAVLDALAAELNAAALAPWADAWHLPLPSVRVGNQRPDDADGWPYLALAPQAERRDLVQGTLDQLTVVLACGVRVDDERSGLRIVADLAEHALAALRATTYTIGRSDLIADYAELADAALVPPQYEVQISVSLRLLSDAHDGGLTP